MNGCTTNSPLVEFANVSVIRDGASLLDRVSLTIRQGEHTVILGANGSGKTTLLRLVEREYYPSVLPDGSQGTVRILGETTWDVSKLRQHFGMISASLDVNFSHGRTGRMTALEAVASGFTATELPEFGIPIDDSVRLAARNALHRVGESALEDRRMETMSTGERRRVLIARAIVHVPLALILDEPTSGLDIAAKVTFLATLRRILSERAMTLVLVTHHIDEILPEIQRTILLDSGRVKFDGSTHNGITSMHLSELFRLRLTVSQTSSGFWQLHHDDFV